MDRIANFITSLKNANLVGKEKIFVPHSKLIWSIAELLKKEGYVKAVKELSLDGKPTHKYIEVVLAYTDINEPKIREVARVSKSSRRIYKGVKEIGVHKRGLGLTVLTTPKGIMTGKDAKKEHVGGEVLFNIF